MLESKLNADIKQALIAQSTENLNYLRYLKSLIQDYKINLQMDRASLLDDALVEKIFSKELKKTKENLVLFKENNSFEAIKKAELEAHILSQFLPNQLTKEEVIQIINQVVDSLKDQDHFSQGLVMKVVIEKTANRADNKLIADLVQERLKK
jgi:uncharacterized protein YqeY